MHFCAERELIRVPPLASDENKLRQIFAWHEAFALTLLRYSDAFP